MIAQHRYRSLGATPGRLCVFSPWLASEEAAATQRALKSLYPKLNADGLWGGCSESAYRQVFGESPTADVLREGYGVPCDSLINYLGTAKRLSCPDNSDAPHLPVILDGLHQFREVKRHQFSEVVPPGRMVTLPSQPAQTQPARNRLRLPDTQPAGNRLRLPTAPPAQHTVPAVPPSVPPQPPQPQYGSASPSAGQSSSKEPFNQKTILIVGGVAVLAVLGWMVYKNRQ